MKQANLNLFKGKIKNRSEKVVVKREVDDNKDRDEEYEDFVKYVL